MGGGGTDGDGGGAGKGVGVGDVRAYVPACARYADGEGAREGDEGGVDGWVGGVVEGAGEVVAGGVGGGGHFFWVWGVGRGWVLWGRDVGASRWGLFELVGCLFVCFDFRESIGAGRSGAGFAGNGKSRGNMQLLQCGGSIENARLQLASLSPRFSHKFFF